MAGTRAKAGKEREKTRKGAGEEEIQNNSKIRMFGCYCFPCLTS